MTETAPLLLLRADAGVHQGSGHVMRGLALAQAWQDAGGRAALLSAALHPRIKDRLAGEGIECLPLAALPGSAGDAQESAACAQRLGAAVVSVDSYALDRSWQEEVRAVAPLLVWDDFGTESTFCADLVLNQNAHANPSNYAGRAPGATLLLGTEHAVLRREFAVQEDAARTPRPTAQRLLVSFGGGDPDGVTLRVLDALWEAGTALEVVALVGAQNPRLAALQARVDAAGPGWELLHFTPDIPRLFASVDLAVSAGGSTTWELCRLGVPTVLVTIAQNQEALSAAVHDQGAAVLLGRQQDVSGAQVAACIAALAQDGPKRAALAATGQALVDGKGGARVVAALRRTAGLPTTGAGP